MSDKFNCNSCGALTDTGYFYCETCHRLHKVKRQTKKEEAKHAVPNTGSTVRDVSDQEKQALQDDGSKTDSVS